MHRQEASFRKYGDGAPESRGVPVSAGSLSPRSEMPLGTGAPSRKTGSGRGGFLQPSGGHSGGDKRALGGQGGTYCFESTETTDGRNREMETRG